MRVYRWELDGELSTQDWVERERGWLSEGYAVVATRRYPHSRHPVKDSFWLAAGDDGLMRKILAHLGLKNDDLSLYCDERPFVYAVNVGADRLADVLVLLDMLEDDQL